MSFVSSFFRKRPLFLCFCCTVLMILFFFPDTYREDPVFPQGTSYSVTATGQLIRCQSGSESLSMTLEDCQIYWQDQVYSCSRLLITLDTDSRLLPWNVSFQDPAVYPVRHREQQLLSSWLQIGNQVSVQGDLISFQPARNPGNFDWRSYYGSQHISYQIYADDVTVIDPSYWHLGQWLFHLQQQFTHHLRELLPEDANTSALLTALLLGDKSTLDPATRSLYEEGGILHILTVSGLHVSLLGTAILTLGDRLALRPWLRSLLSLLGVLCYWYLCGSGMSAGRAVVMFGCLLAAPFFQRSYDSVSALSLAGILILFSSPQMLYQAGFQLSFVSILGIRLVCPVFSPTLDSSPTHKLSPSSFLSSLTSSFLYSLGLQLSLLPVTLYHFFRYPLYAILLNLILLPLSTPLFLLGWSALSLYTLVPFPGQSLALWLILPCQWISSLTHSLCTLAVGLPNASSLLGRPSVVRIVLYYLLLAIFCLRQKRKQDASKRKPSLGSFFKFVLPLLFMVFLLLYPFPKDSMQIVFLDVGQGDGIYLETPSGTTILVDCGSSDIRQLASYRLTPFLESRGVNHLDYVFLSHSDSDHVNAIGDWLDAGGTIGNVMLPALPKPLSDASSYQQLLSLFRSHQIPVSYSSQGDTWTEGSLQIQCLAPVPPEEDQSHLYPDTNTASMVLLVQYQGIRMVLAGDCEGVGESLLLSYLKSNQITCHLLKVGHHGSDGATKETLLQQLSPQIAIISCGIHNRYGHPHPQLLSRLTSRRIQWYTTAQWGAITVTIQRGQATLTTFLPDTS